MTWMNLPPLQAHAAALLVYFSLFFLLAVVWPVSRAYAKTKIWPVIVPRGDDVHGYIGRGFKLGLVLLPLQLIALLSRPDWPVLGWSWFPELPVWAKGSIACVMVLCLAVTMFSQWVMGRSWRIGIDEKNETDLVTHSIFAYSRNPIYLAMRVSLLMQLLLLPTTAVLCLTVWIEVLIQTQVRLEEMYLKRLHGEHYDAYCQRVRRWF